MKKVLVGLGVTAAGVLLLAGPASAHQCTNISKTTHGKADAGSQIMINAFTDEVTPLNAGAAKRLEKGILDEESFRGLLSVDFNGDGVGELQTFIVGPNAEIPTQAQENGSPDHGIVTISFG